MTRPVASGSYPATHAPRSADRTLLRQHLNAPAPPHTPAAGPEQPRRRVPRVPAGHRAVRVRAPQLLVRAHRRRHHHGRHVGDHPRHPVLARAALALHVPAVTRPTLNQALSLQEQQRGTQRAVPHPVAFEWLTLRLLAAPFALHPDFDPAWATVTT